MPHRIQAMHEALAVISTVIGAMIAAVIGVLADVPLSAFQGPAILDDEHARLICIVGALGGALLNLWLDGKPGMPPPGIREMAGKVFASGFTGVAITPFVVRYFGMTANTDTLLLVSLLCAIGGVGLLRTLIPLYQKFVGSKLGIPAQDVQVISDPPPLATPVNPPPVVTKAPTLPPVAGQ